MIDWCKARSERRKNVEKFLKIKTMEKYLGVKLIEAEYWPKSESRSQDGYNIQHDGMRGEWLVKDVFEKAYRKIKSTPSSIDYDNLKEHEVRVAGEMMELNKKTVKLHSFINGSNDIYPKLQETEQLRLQQQLMAMQYYLTMLVERIENFK